MNTAELTQWIHKLIEIDRLDKFYHSRYFTRLKKEVMKEQHYECQLCKERGKLTIVREDIKRSGVVHHMKEVRDYPSLALSKYYIDDGGQRQRQLIVCCNECHEKKHKRFCDREYKRPAEVLNQEKW